MYCSRGVGLADKWPRTRLIWVGKRSTAAGSNPSRRCIERSSSVKAVPRLCAASFRSAIPSRLTLLPIVVFLAEAYRQTNEPVPAWFDLLVDARRNVWRAHAKGQDVLGHNGTDRGRPAVWRDRRLAARRV